MLLPARFIGFLGTITAAAAEDGSNLTLHIARVLHTLQGIDLSTGVACSFSHAVLISPLPVVGARRGISRLGDGKNEQRQ